MTQRGIRLLNSFILRQVCPLYMVPESFVCPGGSPNYQIRYRKHSMTDTEWMHSFSTYSCSISRTESDKSRFDQSMVET